ncbi:MAG: hypothetical protein L0287_07270, partial [Anaerolineae bacterium]|nr:hypothetical protein [Anaerolineae bacterium]
AKHILHSGLRSGNADTANWIPASCLYIHSTECIGRANDGFGDGHYFTALAKGVKSHQLLWV